MTNNLPLKDVKVLDLMWAMAGPASTRILADYGATVVRIESTSRFDAVRTVGPFHNKQPGVENSGLFYNMNAGKTMVTLDLTKETGRAVFLDLVRWADVVSESFSPRVMGAWGLDYESLRKVKPDLIMLSTCLMGQSGPLAKFAGFGNLAAAISGFFNLTGWPDRPPAGPFGAYTDYIAPWFNASAILAALAYRRRTGQGQHIDLSQAEAALHFLGPTLLDYTVNNRARGPAGNRDLDMAPHGVYPATGEDRWIAIAVKNDEQWQALCAVMGQLELLRDSRFATLAARLAHQDDLDAIVAGWTKGLDAQEAEVLLQAQGVPASVIRTMHQLYEDPQLTHRGHFVQLEHPTHETTTVEGSRFKLSRTPAKVDGSAPTLGRDNHHVLEKILGYSEERITKLAAEGVLE